MERLNGKSSFCINSGDGLGFIIAINLARLGAEVTIHDNSPAVVLAAVERLQLAVPGSAVKGVAGDPSTDQGLQSLLDRVGSTDILICDTLGAGAVSFTEAPSEPQSKHLISIHDNVDRLFEGVVRRMPQRDWGRAFWLSTANAPDHLAGGSVNPLLASTDSISAARAGMSIYSILVPSPILSPVSDVMKSEVLRTQNTFDLIVEQFEKDRRPIEIREAAKAILTIIQRINSVCI
ncbi:hypothetical protein [Pseudomonas duriflava]|uniref:hypothetical protein n=1 Tax=Pseudomonas duriflava TaxID=459528 RepID=UPI00119CF607|nr:hypothetical protein [Pseudomonas duriflava]